LTASEIFGKTHHAIYLVIVTGDEPGVVDVIAQGSAVLIAPGRFVTNCHVLEGGKHFIISRREDKVVERALLVNYERGRDLCSSTWRNSSPVSTSRWNSLRRTPCASETRYLPSARYEAWS